MKQYIVNNHILIAAKLTLICFVSVLLLSIVNLVTMGKKEKNTKKAIELANQELFPEGTRFELQEFPDDIPKQLKKSGEYYYIVKNSSGYFIGYIASIRGSGYGGDLNLLIAFSPTLEIINMKLLNNAETPGFGKRWEKQQSMNMFAGTNRPDFPFPRKKSMVALEFQDGPNGITGATITFNGITEAVSRAIRLMEISKTRNTPLP